MSDEKAEENQDDKATDKLSAHRQAFIGRLRDVFGKDGPYIWSRQIGTSANTIKKWLNGETEPGMQSLIALSGATKVRIEWLATGKGPKWVDDPADDDEAGSSHADPKLVRRLTREFSKVYKALGIAVDQLDVVELATEEHNRIRRHAATGQALDAVVGYAVDQLRQRLLQANDEAASRKRPA